MMTALLSGTHWSTTPSGRAGSALKELVASGLSAAEAARWCDLVEKEAARLVKRAAGGPSPRTVRGEQ